VALRLEDNTVTYYGNDIDNYVNGGFTNYYGGNGDDEIFGSAGANEIYGGQGNDFLGGGPLGTLFGSNTPTDPYYYSFGPSGHDYIEGGHGDDAIYGADGDDVLYGGDGNDGGTIVGYFDLLWRGGLYGGEGNDRIDGGAGNDLVDGGLGTDHLRGGGDSDVFQFNQIADSMPGSARDIIYDFSRAEGDQIDLSAIDARINKLGDQPFKFIGKKQFDDKAGELRFAKQKLSGDVDGDGKADFQIKVVDVNRIFKADFDL
jgi:serralysin